MLKLKEFTEEEFEKYIEIYNDFIDNKSELIPDVLELQCRNFNDYQNVLTELNNRKVGNHQDLDWYKNGYYYLAYDDESMVGIGCIRNNLTKKGYEIWGNIAYGIRPSQRNKGYGTKIAIALLTECKKLKMKEIILCHYEDNIVSPKIFDKIGAIYINSIPSTVINKNIKRYRIKL